MLIAGAKEGNACRSASTDLAALVRYALDRQTLICAHSTSGSSSCGVFKSNKITLGHDLADCIEARTGMETHLLVR